MGKTCSVSEAREYDKGQQLPGLTGKVKVVFQPRQKESSAQPGTTYQDQGIVLSDLANPKLELVVSLYDHAPYDKSIVGKVMTVTPGPKGGLKSNGSYEKEGQNGQMQTNYTAAASKACDVTFGGSGAAPSAEAPATTRSAAPQYPNRATAAPGISWSEYLDAESAIASLCIQKALAIANKHNDAVSTLCGVGFEPAQIASIAAGLRISGERAGLSIDSPTSAPTPGPSSKLVGDLTGQQGKPRRAVEPEDPGHSADPDDAFIP